MSPDASDSPSGMVEAVLDPSQPFVGGDDPLEPERVHLLYEIGRSLLELNEPERILETFRDAIVRSLRPDHACLLSVLGDAFRPVFSHGFHLEQPFATWKLSRTALRRAGQSGMSVLALDAAQDAQLRDAESVRSLRIRSVLCVPLGSPVKALLYIDRRAHKERFTRRDLAFLSALSVYAALILDTAEDLARTSDALRVSALRLEALEGRLSSEKIVGDSKALRQSLDDLTRIARDGGRVLLLGETGTGKELFALHYAGIVGRPLVPVAIPTLAPGLVESELFGHVRGAFPGAIRDKIGLLEAAQDSVLFLDEVGEVDPAIQVKLLRFLESGELRRVGDTRVRRVEPLVISGTNRQLDGPDRDSRFRADLLARLGHPIRIPPLRERSEDITALVEHFLRTSGARARSKRFSQESIDRLRSYSWPLNVRELRQLVERVVCLIDSEVILPEHLPDYIRQPQASSATSRAPALNGPPVPLEQVLNEAKKKHILATLEYTQGNKAEAIRLLRISNDTFYRWAKDLDLES